MSSDTTNVVLAILTGTPPTMVALAGLWQALKIGGASKSFHDEAVIRMAESAEHIRLIEGEIVENRKTVLQNAVQVTEQLRELKITTGSLSKARDLIVSNQRKLEENSRLICDIGIQLNAILMRLHELQEFARQHELQKKIEITHEGYGAMG